VGALGLVPDFLLAMAVMKKKKDDRDDLQKMTFDQMTSHIASRCLEDVIDGKKFRSAIVSVALLVLHWKKGNP
jgi:hypothetical protein